MTDCKTMWRIEEVTSRTGLARSTIYYKMARDEFPQSISLGLRATAWIAEEVTEWIEQRIEESRSGE